ncbi:hypothetical protein NUSPORA_00802 [Nucleospora cyclopteri]
MIGLEKRIIKNTEIIRKTIKELEIEEFDFSEITAEEVFAIVETLLEDDFEILKEKIEKKYKNFVKNKENNKFEESKEDEECFSNNSEDFSESADENCTFKEDDWEIISSEDSVLNKPAYEVLNYLNKK